jgi:hypothetical protein
VARRCLAFIHNTLQVWHSHQPALSLISMSQRCPVSCAGIVDLLRSPGIDSQHGGPVRQHHLSYRHARLHRLAESVHRNRFLGSINVYKYGLRLHRLAELVVPWNRFLGSLKVLNSGSRSLLGFPLGLSRPFWILT